MLFLHPVPGGLVAVLEVQPFAIRAVAEDHRIPALLDRTEDVGAQHEPVVHFDRHVPIDLHPVADLADFAVAHSNLQMSVVTGAPETQTPNPCPRAGVWIPDSLAFARLPERASPACRARYCDVDSGAMLTLVPATKTSGHH